MTMRDIFDRVLGYRERHKGRSPLEIHASADLIAQVCGRPEVEIIRHMDGSVGYAFGAPWYLDASLTGEQLRFVP